MHWGLVNRLLRGSNNGQITFLSAKGPETRLITQQLRSFLGRISSSSSLRRRRRSGDSASSSLNHRARLNSFLPNWFMAFQRAEPFTSSIFLPKMTTKKQNRNTFCVSSRKMFHQVRFSKYIWAEIGMQFTPRLKYIEISIIWNLEKWLIKPCRFRIDRPYKYLCISGDACTWKVVFRLRLNLSHK